MISKKTKFEKDLEARLLAEYEELHEEIMAMRHDLIPSSIAEILRRLAHTKASLVIYRRSYAIPKPSID